MARIIGGIGTSHIPAIGGAIHKGLQDEPYWKPFFGSFPPIHDWLASARPDVVVVFYNDHGLNFFLDKMPTFAVGAASRYVSADEGWGIPPQPAVEGCQDLSWQLVDTLVDRGFDITSCQEMRVDHACTLPLKLLWPACGDTWPVRIVPVCINTVQFPLPKASRVYALGKAVGEAVAAWGSDQRVLMVASGGLSHQLDGARAGHINKSFDLQFLDSLASNPEWATQFSIHDLVEKTGTQGIELLMWLAMRASLTAAGPSVRKVHGNYHIPISNTATAVLALEVP